MTTITISGLPGSGKTTVATLLEKETGLAYVYSGKIFRTMAKKYKMTLDDFGRYAETHEEVDKELDEYQRPKIFYGKLIHENCPRRAYFDEGKFARKFGEPGCLNELGCKGPVTHADCPLRTWNQGVNWCIGAGSPCIGCCEPGFPDLLAPFYEKLTDASLPTIGSSQVKEVD